MAKCGCAAANLTGLQVFGVRELDISESSLSGLTSADVCLSPFPHIVVRPALDQRVCRQLIEEMPPLSDFTKDDNYPSNTRYDINASAVLQRDDLASIWKEIVSLHTNQKFIQQFLDIFAVAIRKEFHKSVADDLLSGELRSGIRYVDGFDQADILLESQIGVNTPVIGEATKVRGPHLDAPNKLYTGLLYLRHPDDDSTGGDLELCTTTETAFGHELSIRDELSQTVSTIKYEANTLVLFLNTPRSLHGVTQRFPTTFPRFFINLNATWKKPLFDVHLVKNKRNRLFGNIAKYAGRLPGLSKARESGNENR